MALPMSAMTSKEEVYRHQETQVQPDQQYARRHGKARTRRGTRDGGRTGSLDCAGVGEHGKYVLHLASSEFPHERDASVGIDFEHVS